MRFKRPDKKNAESMLDAAEREMRFTLTLKLDDASSSTIVRNIYECFRTMGDALLVSKGISSEDHIMPIRELTKVNINTKRPLNTLDNLRRLRHNINYYGYNPTRSEAQDTLSIADNLFWPLLKEIKDRINE